LHCRQAPSVRTHIGKRLAIFVFFVHPAALTHALPQVRFFSVPDCVAAQQKMHGRFFAKRQILTEFLNVDDFDQLKKDTGK